jgi:TolB-like protein
LQRLFASLLSASNRRQQSRQLPSAVGESHRGSATEYFVDGMTDTLIGDLAKIGALRVISRTSTMQYKGTKKSLPQIAKELNVTP